MIGMAKSRRNWATSDIHTNTGMRMRLMPGARMLMTVTIKLTAPLRDAMPRIWRPKTQKSMLWPGMTSVRGVYPNQPPLGMPPRKKLEYMNSPPTRKTQIAQGVEPGEGDVAGADHQGQQVVGEPGRHRHDHQEDHGGAVHGEDLVVHVGAEEGALGRPQLPAQQHGLEAAEQEEQPGGEGVHQADLLVVDGGDPSPQALRGAGGAAEQLDRRGLDRGGNSGGGGTGDGGHQCPHPPEAAAGEVVGLWFIASVSR